jgi:hypothetical protein
MKLLVLATLSIATLANGAALAASACRGLPQPACTTQEGCKWQAARVAGETLGKNGQPHKSSAKAHCRLSSRSVATAKN